MWLEDNLMTADAIVPVISEYLLSPFTGLRYERALNLFYVSRYIILGAARAIFTQKKASDVKR